MTDKLSGIRRKHATEDDVVNAIEGTPAELVADPEISVPTGDEAGPVSTPNHAEGLKSLYDKSKHNRELVQRDDAELSPDVERLQAMTNEASGGKSDGSEMLNTNRSDREAEEDAATYTARLIQEEQDRQAAADEDPKPKEELKQPLKEEDGSGMVVVTILGRTMTVPRQDIDDAGGVAAYQMNRAANIKLERAATLEKDAQAQLHEVETKRGVQIADLPNTDGLSEADIDSLHEEMMDAVIDGTEDDMKAWIAEKLKPKVAKPRTVDTRSDEPHVVKNVTQEELDSQHEADRIDANTMMESEYSDVMDDSDLLGLAQQRFNVIKTNPDNQGRSQRDMAREAANHARSIARRWGKQDDTPSPIEKERQTRIERKRTLPQSSQADQTAPPANNPKERSIPSSREHLARLRRRAGHDLAS